MNNKPIRRFLRYALSASLLLALIAGAVTVHAAFAATFLGGAFVDSFNDGVIGDRWNSQATDGSSIYEAGGVLNMEIAEGKPPYNPSQLVYTYTKEEILKGDFDVRVDFELDPTFHSKDSPNAALEVGVSRGLNDGFTAPNDTIGIRIFAHNNYSSYYSYEGHQDAGGGYITHQAFTPTDDLTGKLRIRRVGNLITTFYWDHGWVQHSQWEPVLVFPSDNLSIGLIAFNWEPDLPSFWVKWDNLVSYYHRG